MKPLRKAPQETNAGLSGMFKSNSPRYVIPEEATSSVSVGPNGEYVFGAFNNSGVRVG